MIETAADVRRVADRVMQTTGCSETQAVAMLIDRLTAEQARHDDQATVAHLGRAIQIAEAELSGAMLRDSRRPVRSKRRR